MVCIDLETSHVVSQQTSMTREGPMEAGQCPFTAARFSICCRLVAEKMEECLIIVDTTGRRIENGY